MAGEYNDPQDLHDEAVEVAAVAVEMAEAGRCPRCGERFTDGEIQSGSRVTRCRCVPVCATCGESESFPIPMVDWLGVWEWVAADAVREVTSATDRTRERGAVARWKQEHPREPGLLMRNSNGDPVLLHSEGVAEIHYPDTGGWATYGYTDAEDRAERER